LIVLDEVTKIFPGAREPAVDRVSFQVTEGNICVFVGPSGCGKTTILRMINRLEEPTDGDIYIKGERVKDKHVNADELRREIGYVIQQVGLLPHQTVEQNVALVPRLLKWPADKIRSRVAELLQMVGLDPQEISHKYPYQLSGGMMQRVGVARALAADPPIMLMDEPFGAVDPIVRERLQDEFLRLQKELKKTICFVTHDINEAIKMGDHIVILAAGKLIQHGTPREILTAPANDFVKDLIGENKEIKLLELTRAAELVKPQAELPPALSSNGCCVQSIDPVQRALEIMLKENSDTVGVRDGDELIGAISWAAIKEYINAINANI